MSSRRLQDVFKTPWKTKKFYTEDVLKTSSRRLQYVFTKTNSSWLICELYKTLEINASMLLNLDPANNTIFSCFFSSSQFLTFTLCNSHNNSHNSLARNLLVHFTHQSIFIDIFNKQISCVIYISQFYLLAYVFFNHIFKVIIYFQLNQEFLIFQLILLL